MTDERVRIERSLPRLVVTLNAPDRRNALGPGMIATVRRALREAHADPHVHAVILTGEGRSFCAGGELDATDGHGNADADADADGDSDSDDGSSYAALLLAMLRSEVPIIARVNGDALDRGLGLVAASTFALAVEEAMLGTPEIDAALFPMTILSLVARLVPRRRLHRMMFLNEPMTAAEAAEVGLVDRDVASVHLDEFVDALVAKISSKSRTTVSHGLRALHAQEGIPVEGSRAMLEERLLLLRQTDDASASVAALLERRRRKVV